MDKTEYPLPERSKWNASTTHADPRPHHACCAGCAAEGVCWVCGKATTAGTGKCTNGACRDCHHNRAHADG